MGDSNRQLLVVGAAGAEAALVLYQENAAGIRTRASEPERLELEGGGNGAALRACLVGHPFFGARLLDGDSGLSLGLVHIGSPPLVDLPFVWRREITKGEALLAHGRIGCPGLAIHVARILVVDVEPEGIYHAILASDADGAGAFRCAFEEIDDEAADQLFRAVIEGLSRAYPEIPRNRFDDSGRVSRLIRSQLDSFRTEFAGRAADEVSLPELALPPLAEQGRIVFRLPEDCIDRAKTEVASIFQRLAPNLGPGDRVLLCGRDSALPWVREAFRSQFPPTRSLVVSIRGATALGAALSLAEEQGFPRENGGAIELIQGERTRSLLLIPPGSGESIRQVASIELEERFDPTTDWRLSFVLGWVDRSGYEEAIGLSIRREGGRWRELGRLDGLAGVRSTLARQVEESFNGEKRQRTRCEIAVESRNGGREIELSFVDRQLPSYCWRRVQP